MLTIFRKLLLVLPLVSLSTMAAELPGDPAAGEEIYIDVCEECHQLDGTGENGATAGDFVNDKKILSQSNEELLQTIFDGKGDPIDGMPSMRDELSDQEMKDVLSYIRQTFGS
ncbi:MAG: cytochrome c [Candidatus Polarisedimenticolaceae bacterium]|nr:cytochrome c [Candidatus Polarisedimenticolaceae bacterium]